MQYLDSLIKCFDKQAQSDLFFRIGIRLKQVAVFQDYTYTSEEDFNNQFPINRECFQFREWTNLREEIENLAIKYSNMPKLLESMLVRYLLPFDTASVHLFRDELHSIEAEDENYDTGTTLMYISNFFAQISSNSRVDPSLGAKMMDFLKKKKVGPLTEEFIMGLRRDFDQLHMLKRGMFFLADIIQGVLYEIEAPFSLQTIQSDCNIILTDKLLAWRMGPLMGWPTDYCYTLMGNEYMLSLDHKHGSTTPSALQDSYKDENKQSEPTAPSQVEESNGSNSKLKLKQRKAKKNELSERKLQLFANGLNQIDKTAIKYIPETDSWQFNLNDEWYAYMGNKITEVCGNDQVSWKDLMNVIAPNHTKESEPIRKRAERQRKTKKYPNGYSIIDRVVNKVFK